MKLQLLDGGVIHSFKSHYRKQLSLRALSYIDEGKTWNDFMKNFSARQAVDLMKTAWASVDSSVIVSCARHVGWSVGQVDGALMQTDNQNTLVDTEDLQEMEDNENVHPPVASLEEFLQPAVNEEVSLHKVFNSIDTLYKIILDFVGPRLR